MHPIKLLTGISLVTLVLSCADYSLINDMPPAPSLVVSGVKDSTITIHWTMCSDENFASYRIYYDTTDVVDKSSIFVDSLLFVGDTVKSIGSLKPATQYYVRVFTRNTQGKENASNTVTAVTQLAFHTAQKAGDSGVMVSWSPLKKTSFDGFRVCFDTTDNVDTADRRLNSGSLVAASDTSLVIGQVPLGQTWRIKVFAMAGDSVVTSTSGIQNIAGWWFNLLAPDMLTDSTVMLRWSRPRTSAGGAGVSEFRVFAAAKLPVDTADTIVAKVSAADTSKLLYNMASRGFKYFRVFARGASGYIGSTEAAAYTSIAPAKLTPGEIRDTAVPLRWTRCADGNFLQYRVYCDTSSSVGSGSRCIDTVTAPQDTVKTVGGLVPGTHYYFRIATINTGDKAAWSNIIASVTLLRFKPMQQVKPGDSAVSIGWTPLKGGALDEYRLYRDSLSDKVDTADVLEKNIRATDSGCSLVNIPLGESRRYRVYARADTGILSMTSAIATVNGWWFDLKSVDMRSDTTVMLRWTKPKTGVLQFRIFAADAAPVDTAGTPVKTVSGTVDSVLIRIAIPEGGTKIFKVFAWSDTGYLGWSQAISYQPLEASALSISNVRDTSALVQWTRSADMNFAQYRLYWDSLATIGPAGRVLDSFAFADNTSKSVTGLKPASVNYFRVVTINDRGWMAWSAPASIVTPIQFRTTQNTGDSITQVRWSPLHGISPISYRIYRDTANSTDTSDDISKTLLIADSTYSAAKIPLGSSQRFRVVARADTGVITATGTVLTVNGRWFDQYAPAMQADSTILLKWPKQGAMVKSYAVFSATNGNVDTTSILVEENVTDTVKILPAITKGSSAYYRIFAKSDTGYVGSSPVKKYTAQ